MIIKQNKKTVTICSLLTFAFLLAIASFPAHASGTTFNFVLPVGNTPQTDGVPIYSSNQSNNKYFVFSASATPVYVCFSNDIATRSTTTAGYFFFSVVDFTLYSGDSRYPNGGISTSRAQYDSERNFYYVGPSGYDGSTPLDSVPVFNTRSAAFDAFESQIVNPPPEPVPAGHSLTYTVPYGNAIILEFSGLSGQGTLLTSSPNPSFNFFSSVSGGHFTTLPESIEYPMTGLVQYSWSGSGRQDVNGRYSYFAASFSYDATDISDNSYYVIVNPPFTAGIATDYVLNGDLIVSVSNVSSFQIVPLNTQVSYGGNQSSVQDGDGGTGTYDDDGGNWIVTDPEGNPYAPQDGGADQPIEPTMSIHDYLQQIANTIKGFFSGAIGAISTLVASGSTFMRQLVSLYSWLPPAVLSVLSSALILVITIGVIKVFL